MRSSNRIYDAFDAIKADEELKSLTKDYLKAARQQKHRAGASAKRRQASFRLALGVVCAMIVMFLGISGYTLLCIPVSYVSIDVNPSIELTLNRLDRVLSAEAYNEDGEIVLNAISLQGLRYTDAIDRMVESEAMQSYLGVDAGLTFTVAADSGQKESSLLAGIENTTGCREHGGVGYGADIGTVQEAHDNGLSLGKYAAYQVLSQYDSSITAEECHNMSMSEIHGMIESHEHGMGHDEEHDGGHQEEKRHESGAGGSGNGAQSGNDVESESGVVSGTDEEGEGGAENGDESTAGGGEGQQGNSSGYNETSWPDGTGSCEESESKREENHDSQENSGHKSGGGRHGTGHGH